jgi:hypothetical protein
MKPTISSAELARIIAQERFSSNSVLLIGAGTMGRQYLQALKRLQVTAIRLCRQSQSMVHEHTALEGVQILGGGFLALKRRGPDETAIVALPMDRTVAAVEHLLNLGYKQILCEKPISLWADELIHLEKKAANLGAHIYCALNRVAYPSFCELQFLALREGGFQSASYDFSEILSRFNTASYPIDAQKRWGVANSLHVISMAHRLIGLPKDITSYRSGSLSWHPSGSAFVGAGLSEQEIPFSYHAVWGNTGRWSLELHTAKAAYRLCPLEQLVRREDPLGDWKAISLSVFAPEIKSGILEETAAFLSPTVRSVLPLVLIKEAASYVRLTEALCGYEPAQTSRLVVAEEAKQGRP